MDAHWPERGLTDGHVLLRRWREADAEQVVGLHDAEARRWNPPVADPSPEALRARVLEAVAAPPDALPASYAVADADRPEVLLGSIDWRATAVMPPFSVVDIGYTVAPSARGRGVATTALLLLGDWLLSPSGGGLHRVQLDHAVGNVGSCRVAVKAGMPVEGRRPGFLPLAPTPGGPLVFHDTCLHGRVAA